jgi:hypothetical protein
MPKRNQTNKQVEMLSQSAQGKKPRSINALQAVLFASSLPVIELENRKYPQPLNSETCGIAIAFEFRKNLMAAGLSFHRSLLTVEAATVLLNVLKTKYSISFDVKDYNLKKSFLDSYF